MKLVLGCLVMEDRHTGEKLAFYKLAGPSTEFMKLNMHNIKSIDHTTMIAHTMSFMSSLKGYEHSS